MEKNKNNCSVQLCGSRYFLAGFCRLSLVKVWMGEQSQGCCNNRVHGELKQIVCTTVLGWDSPYYMKDGKRSVSKMLLIPHDLNDVWLTVGQKYPSYSFFNHTWPMELKIKQKERNKNYSLNALKIIKMVIRLSNYELNSSWGTSWGAPKATVIPSHTIF